MRACSDVSSGIDFSYMFQDALSFNQYLSRWNVSHANDMGAMFWNAQSFDSNLSSWDVSSVVQMSSMFRESAFTGDISSWQVGALDSFGAMFLNTEYNHNLCSWGPPLQERHLEDAAGRAAWTSEMFKNSSCPDPNDPNIRQDPAGPFCHKCTSSGENDENASPTALAPRNDVCTGAIPVTWTPQPLIDESFLLFNTPGTTLTANVDIIPGCTPDPPAPGVWYSVLGTGDILEAVTCFGTSFDTWISVAVGGSSSCGNLTCVVFEDAGCVSSESGTSIAWPSVANETYYIHVGGATPNATGTFNLVVSSYSQVLAPPFVRR